MKLKTVTYHTGYRLSHDYNSVEGQVEATAEVEDGEAPDEAYHALRKLVRKWIRDDYAEGRKIVGLTPHASATTA
jgi:hypothetical protein